MQYPLNLRVKEETLRARARAISGCNAVSLDIYILLLRISQELQIIVQEFLLNYGLSEGRLTILGLLQDAPEHILTPSELADQLGLSRTAVTGLLDGLEKAGLIERQAHKRDRRMIITRLTEKGDQLFKELIPQYIDCIRQAMLRLQLSKEEQQQLLKLLQKANATLFCGS
jgi:DNA-binding MarR family transcriptional regulator